VSPDTGLEAGEQTSPRALTAAEAGTLGALLERMFPADELGPGALEIGVLDYLERALAGPYAELVPLYRRALAGIDEAARAEYGWAFDDLPPENQDVLIDRLERRQLEGVDQSDGPAFFDLVWRHLREGLFADPIHGGNRNMLGWRLIGFPGAQPGYTATEQRLDVVITREPRSVADLPSSMGRAT